MIYVNLSSGKEIDTRNQLVSQIRSSFTVTMSYLIKDYVSHIKEYFLGKTVMNEITRIIEIIPFYGPLLA